MKKIHFLTGFPRSGNTLLTTILNQNKDIAATGHSTVPSIFYVLSEVASTNIIYNTFKNYECFENVHKELLQTYYAPWKQKIIIDRGEWCTPFNFKMVQTWGPSDVKIIFLIRDPLEVIKSYLSICENYPNFYVNQKYDALDPTALYRTEIEEKIDIITAKKGLFDYMCMSYNHVIKNNLHKKCVQFINYDDLINYPEKTFKTIYKFLKIPYYKHKFNIENNFSVNGIAHDDQILGAPLHELILGKVKKYSRYNIKLPKSTVIKYKNFLQHA